MSSRLPLRGIRVHLSGSIPEGSTKEKADGIAAFVEQLTRAVLSEGGTLVHGSHPTLIAALRAAAKPFVAAGGSREDVVLVRAQKYATSAHSEEITAQREWASVQIIPHSSANPKESLVPMREWMADRCDVVIAVGGKHWQVNRGSAGVPEELEE